MSKNHATALICNVRAGVGINVAMDPESPGNRDWISISMKGFKDYHSSRCGLLTLVQVNPVIAGLIIAIPGRRNCQNLFRVPWE